MNLGQVKVLVALYVYPTGKATVADIAPLVDATRPTVNTRLQALMGKGFVWASPAFPRSYYLTTKGRVYIRTLAGYNAA